MLPLCRFEGVGVVPWSPQARGLLTCPAGADPSVREGQDSILEQLYTRTRDADRRVIDRVGEVAERLAVSRSQVALRWVMQTAGVSAPIIGATKISQLDEALASTSFELSGQDMEYLQESYVAHEVAGHV